MSVDFESRLQAARLAVGDLIAGRPASATAAEVDQIRAAASEAEDTARRIGEALRRLEPERWSALQSDRAGAEILARVLVAMESMDTTCPHLRQAGPQPAFVRLPLHRIDCARCSSTVRRPPVDEDDRCDWCGTRGVVEFTPIVMQHGPLVVLGDACPGCAEVLVEGASS